MRSIVGVFGVALALVLVGPAAAFGAGSISGTVTSANGGAPIADVEVCAWAVVSEDFACGETAVDGTYSVANLPAGTYKVEFWPPQGANYFPQYYSGKSTWTEATPVTVNDGADTPGIDATLAEGGQIVGHVTDATSKAGIQGITVCAVIPDEEFGRCAYTGSGGEYAIARLPTGSYEVFFFEEAEPSEYLGEIYRGNQRELVPVTVGLTTSGIDAALSKAGKIAGTVTDALSGAGIGFSTVCARQATTGEIYECAYTNRRGQYAIAGLPSGAYRVWFSPDVPAWEEEDDYFQQYYSGAAVFAQATPVTVVAPAPVTGIDARLLSRKAPAVMPPPPPLVAKPRKKHCHKGLKRIRVKGKERCVKIHHKHHRRSHRHGPHAVATGH
jgi:hypothetical protein